MAENQLTLIEDSITSLQTLVQDSLASQLEFSPIYNSIMDKILGMLDKEDELKAWEAKDLLKLLDLAGKARLAPIEQLTKLIQAIQALQETSKLQEKMDSLADVVQEIKDAKEGIIKNVPQHEVIDIEDIDPAEYTELEED
jgi:CBS domain containing-hemolysin-like protein